MRHDIHSLMQRLDGALSATVDVSTVAWEAAQEVEMQKGNLQESEQQRQALEDKLEAALASSIRAEEQKATLEDELEEALVRQIQVVGELERALRSKKDMECHIESLQKEVAHALRGAIDATEELERSLVGSETVVHELQVVESELKDAQRDLWKTQSEAQRLAHATINLELDHISATEDVSATNAALKEMQMARDQAESECLNLRSQLDEATAQMAAPGMDLAERAASLERRLSPGRQ